MATTQQIAVSLFDPRGIETGNVIHLRHFKLSENKAVETELRGLKLLKHGKYVIYLAEVLMETSVRVGDVCRFADQDAPAPLKASRNVSATFVTSPDNHDLKLYAEINQPSLCIEICQTKMKTFKDDRGTFIRIAVLVDHLAEEVPELKATKIYLCAWSQGHRTQIAKFSAMDGGLRLRGLTKDSKPLLDAIKISPAQFLRLPAAMRAWMHTYFAQPEATQTWMDLFAEIPAARLSLAADAARQAVAQRQPSEQAADLKLDMTFLELDPLVPLLGSGDWPTSFDVNRLLRSPSPEKVTCLSLPPTESPGKHRLDSQDPTERKCRKVY